MIQRAAESTLDIKFNKSLTPYREQQKVPPYFLVRIHITPVA